jgi:hypothetical protein
MKRIKVTRVDGVFDILLLKHKTYNGYSFVNLTKGHICPCVFKSEEEAMADLEKYKQSGKIVDYE